MTDHEISGSASPAGLEQEQSRLLRKSRLVRADHADQPHSQHNERDEGRLARTSRTFGAKIAECSAQEHA